MNRFFTRRAARAAAAILTGALTLGLFGGCNSSGSVSSVEKINAANAKYAVREQYVNKLDASRLYGASADSKLVDDDFLAVLGAIAEDVEAEAYVIDFSGTRGEFDDTAAAEEYAASYLEANGIDTIARDELTANGFWGALVDGRLESDIKTVWLNRYENLDGEMEYVADVSRNKQPLRTLRYTVDGGKANLLSNELGVNYDGREPEEQTIAAPAETGSASTMYFRGVLNRTGIYEQPVVGGVDFTFSISAKGVAGEYAGGFAGMLEGSVTIDGVGMSFTADGNNIPVPLSMVEDPSEWYIGFAKVSTNNPQDTTGYRNIFFVRTDFSEVVGLYMAYRSAEVNEWFDATRVTKSEFDAAVAENNKKLTDLYAAVMRDAYGNKKEYNNLLAVLYNMFVGVEQNYLRKNLTSAISVISTDIRDYAECYTDESVANFGQNEYWFFPDGRSTVCRVYEYDGETAIVAVDFSTKQDDGYGGLYRASYDGAGWALETLKVGRIR